MTRIKASLEHNAEPVTLPMVGNLPKWIIPSLLSISMENIQRWLARIVIRIICSKAHPWTALPAISRMMLTPANSAQSVRPVTHLKVGSLRRWITLNSPSSSTANMQPPLVQIAIRIICSKARPWIARPVILKMMRMPVRLAHNAEPVTAPAAGVPLRLITMRFHSS